MVAIIGGNERSIRLDSVRGNSIDNAQVLEITDFEANQHGDFDSEYGARFDIVRRHAPTALYNCHGLTFASRRTWISKNSALWQVISEDSYAEVAKTEVKPGDVIIYFDEDNNFEHSGIVIKPPTEANLFIPYVCSKWAKYSELLHWATDCPYSFANVKYYRMRL